jgi:hypothetical protein
MKGKIRDKFSAKSSKTYRKAAAGQQASHYFGTLATFSAMMLLRFVLQ